jgi:hypothetical protein
MEKGFVVVSVGVAAVSGVAVSAYLIGSGKLSGLDFVGGVFSLLSGAACLGGPIALQLMHGLERNSDPKETKLRESLCVGGWVVRTFSFWCFFIWLVQGWSCRPFRILLCYYASEWFGGSCVWGCWCRCHVCFVQTLDPVIKT